jgi:hypothetical protein
MGIRCIKYKIAGVHTLKNRNSEKKATFLRIIFYSLKTYFYKTIENFNITSCSQKYLNVFSKHMTWSTKLCKKIKISQEAIKILQKYFPRHDFTNCNKIPFDFKVAFPPHHPAVGFFTTMRSFR